MHREAWEAVLLVLGLIVVWIATREDE